MGSAIHRQVDVRDDVVSLGRLVDRVWRYPTVLSRKRFIALQGIDDAPMVNGWFNDLAGSGDCINPEIPAQDMEDLREKTAEVRGRVDKAVGHKDTKGREAPPLSEVHACIDAIFEVFNKYMALIRGVSVANDVVMTIWPTIFRTQWIPDDQWEAIAGAVDRIGQEELASPQSRMRRGRDLAEELEPLPIHVRGYRHDRVHRGRVLRRQPEALEGIVEERDTVVRGGECTWRLASVEVEK